ncbi:HCN2 [Symbiodinium sp. CCMP2592]|nr:HCN2 [Symbiodinium sp. CCMP2592]
MSLTWQVHLKNWAIEEVADNLSLQSASADSWVLQLITALWTDFPICEFFVEAAYILPATSFWKLVSFARTNYPNQTLPILDEVGLASPGHPEASAKIGGYLPVPSSHHLSKIQKRSFKRAVARAQKYGSAVYRGKRLVASAPNLPTSTTTVHTKPLQSDRARLRCVTWNSDGLTQELLVQLLSWLDAEPMVHVAFIQETHWGFDGDWTQGKWHFCHSAAERRRTGGVLIAMRADIFAKEQIRWQAIEPGRILHARCYANKQHLDLVCFYQHALPFGSEQQKEVMTKRLGVWKKLDGLLGAQPVRSSLILSGDFNCVLPVLAPCIGCGVHIGSSAKHLVEERNMVAGILKKHDLCVVNSWGRKHWTYHHPKGRSQIDYIVVRRSIVDGLARQATAVQSPLAGWRSSGHMPVRASLKLDWRPWQQCKSKSRPVPLVERPSQHPVLKGMKEAMLAKHTPAAVPQRPALANIEGPVKKFWRCHALLAAAKAHPIPDRLTFAMIFARLKLHSDMQRAHRELKRMSRERKRQQQLEILQIAEQAARRGDSKELFRCVRWLAPKQHKQSIRLRTSSGCLMSPGEECVALAAHAKQLFSGQPFDAPDMLQLPLDMFEGDKWGFALCKIKANKAVPLAEPPGELWKEDIPQLAQQLAAVSQACLCTPNPIIPLEWSTVQLAWLPKPLKSPSCPANLRTIGLMPVDAKAFLILLRQEAEQYVAQAVHDCPQYAYRSQAGTADALLRASHHCLEVRSLAAACHQDYTSKIIGEHLPDVVGGLMCNLDLAKAFDTVPYNELYWSMRDIGLLNQKLGGGWAQAHLTTFADDTHGFWTLRAPSAFIQACGELKTVIDVLRGMGMTINFTKSVVVVKIHGKAAPGLFKRFFRKMHGTQSLRLRSDGDVDVFLPCANQLEYLGAVLSYDSFEGRTVQHRAAKAESVYNQLRKVLRVNGPLTAPYRLRIYCAIVVSSLLYGLTSIGVTAEVVRKVSSTVAGHLRKVLRVYEHGITNEQVLQRAGISPLHLLQHRTQRLHEHILRDPGRSDGLKCIEQERCASILAQLEALAAQPQQLSIQSVRRAEICVVDCPVCGIEFGTAEGLSMHLHRRHPEIQSASKLVLDRQQHALFGVPMCRFCHTRSCDWSALAKHIEEGHCRWIQHQIASGHAPSTLLELIAKEEACKPPQPPEGLQTDDALQAARALLREPNSSLPRIGSQLCGLSKRCLLCAQHVRYAARIKPHWQVQHPGAWKQCQQGAQSESASLVALFARPCKFCGSQAKNTRDHASQCPALFQFLAGRQLELAGHTLSEAAHPAFRASASTTKPEPKQQRLDSLFRKSTGQPVTVSNTNAPAVAISQVPQSSTVARPFPCPADLPSDWLHRLILRNPSNHCYANAGMLALLTALEGQSTYPGALKALRQTAVQAAVSGIPLTLSQQFVLRSVMCNWPFNPAQQDTVEFISHLIETARIDVGRWESRIQGPDAVEVYTHDSGPVQIPTVGRECTLQEAINKWHQQGALHALCYPPARLLVYLNRYTGAAKSFSQVWFDAEIAMPVFTHGMNLRWIPYQAISAVLHFGATPLAGHYRALLRDGSQWHFTQDGIRAKPQTILRQHRCNVYAVWLQRKAPTADPDPAPSSL